MGYKKDGTAHSVKVTEKNDAKNPAVVTIAHEPGDDPINFEIKKYLIAMN